MPGATLKNITLSATPAVIEALKDEPFALNMISELYESRLTPIKTTGVQKIIVELHEEDPGESGSARLVDVVTIQSRLDSAAYLVLDARSGSRLRTRRRAPSFARCPMRAFLLPCRRCLAAIGKTEWISRTAVRIHHASASQGFARARHALDRLETIAHKE